MDREVASAAAWTPLAAWAQQAHETFTALSEAGFTERQALLLIGEMTRTGDHGSTPRPE